MSKFLGTPLIDFDSSARIGEKMGKNVSWEGQIYEFAGSWGIRRCYAMLQVVESVYILSETQPTIMDSQLSKIRS